MSNIEPDTGSVRRASLVAGIGLLAMAVLASFSEFVVLENLVTVGDATRTATDLSDAIGLFRAGIASLFLVAILDVVVAWALFTVFEPVSRRLSMLAAWLRVVYAGVLVVAIGQLVGVLRLLVGTDALAVFGTEQLHAQVLLGIDSFYAIRDVGFFLFGTHLLLLGYLAYRAGYVPTVLGILVAIAGLGYAIDSLGPVLSAGYTVELATFTFVGEVALLLWLLVRGRRVDPVDPPATAAD